MTESNRPDRRGPGSATAAAMDGYGQGGGHERAETGYARAMLRSITVASYLALMLCAAAGCRSKAKPPPTPEAVTMAEAQALGEAIERSLAVCEPSTLDDALDIEHTVRLAAAGHSLTDAERRDIVKGAKSAMALGRELCADVASGSQYRLLRAREQAGEVSLVFRSLGEQGLNYLEFYVGKGPADQPRIYDAYMYINGERFSETMGDMLAAFMGSKDLQRSATTFSREIQNARDHLRANELEQAGAALRRLPPAMKVRKPVRLLEVMVAFDDDEAYEKAIASYEAAYPGDPSLDLVSIDGHLLRKQYDEGIAALERLDQRIGGDPYLQVLGATFLSEKGDLDGAWTRVQDAIAREPELENAYWVAIMIALERESFDDAVAIMTTLRDRFEVQFDPDLMAGEALYAGFLQSPQWTAWTAAAAAPGSP